MLFVAVADWLSAATDEVLSYRGISDAKACPQTVNHAAKESRIGDVHTKGAEGARSFLKRSIIGSFHKASFRHLDRYLGELAWRFNNALMFRDLLVRLPERRPLPHRALVA